MIIFLTFLDPRGIVVNVVDCDIEVSGFELQSHNCAHFGTNSLRTGGGARGVMVIVVEKRSRRHEFKSWTRLIAFHIAPIPLGKV